MQKTNDNQARDAVASWPERFKVLGCFGCPTPHGGEMPWGFVFFAYVEAYSPQPRLCRQIQMVDTFFFENS